MSGASSKLGLILFAHGARDPAWAAPFERMRERLVAQAAGVPVCLAYLEFMQPDLSAAVAQLRAQGCTSVKVLPVFMAAGGHLKRDLPVLASDAAAAHGVEVRVLPPVGDDDSVIDAIVGVALRATLLANVGG
jgi:sirohydrochlorin cobaltochelatase